MKMLNQIIIIVILSFTIIGFSPARAQIAHENPDKLSYQQPYDTYQQLDNDRERMFQEVDSFVQHITTSDFNASRQDVKEFNGYYNDYINQLALCYNPKPEYNELIPVIFEIQNDLTIINNNPELYALNQSLFGTYGSESGLLGGNASSAGPGNSSIKTSQSAGESNINVTIVRSLLKNSNIDMQRLEDSLGLLESFADGSLESYLLQGRETGDNYLNLSANSTEVSTGNRTDLMPKLAESNVTAAGDTTIGNASTTEVSAGSIFIVPIRMTPFTIGAAISVGLVGVAATWAIDRRVRRPGRQARRRPAMTRATAPAVEAPLSYAGKFEGLLRQINEDIAAGKDRTGVIASIYIAVRLIARSQGIEVSDSSTPNEFRLLFTKAKPPVSPLLNVIIASYEGAAFGHRPLTEQNLVDARKCLVEIRKMTGGEGA